ncbi:MAG TPA: biotin/lipoyl-binding protein [Planctomycetaceae bacterium]|nr:biotin/lipoyl-binding protein [Planctomycetaceae bacterium]HIQ23038.1 biotin/lipoyl-binding protein [Planctomycetota bacterium]
MKLQSVLSVWRRMPKPVVMAAYGLVTFAVGAGCGYWAAGRSASSVAAAHAGGGEEQGADRDHSAEGYGDEAQAIVLSPAKQIAAGVRVEPVRRGKLVETVRVTGKVALNQDRITRLHPLVEGRVHEVHVNFGDRVKAGQVLAVIDSQQVGRTKLELYKSQRETRLAEVNYQWQKTVYENTLALIEALEEGIAITEIEKRFRDKPMGEYRDQLLSA